MTSTPRRRRLASHDAFTRSGLASTSVAVPPPGLGTRPNFVIQPSLGRPLSNSATTATVNLIQPGTLYGDRVNEIDIRFAKIVRFGRTRTNVGVDVYNLINTSPILTYNQNFVPNGNWLVPTSVLQPRFLKFSATFDF